MTDDNDEALSRLTEAQKECLRLVAANFKSKEIAHQLGIGVDAVNKRIAAATATLQVSSRAVAARRLSAAEANGSYHSLVGQTLAVEPGADAADPEGTPQPDQDHDDLAPRSALEEPQAPYTLVTVPLVPDPPHADARGRSWFTTPRIFLLALGAGALLELATRI